MDQKENLISGLIHYLFPGAIAMLNIDYYDCEIVFKDGDVVILDMDDDIIPLLSSFRGIICHLKGD